MADSQRTLLAASVLLKPFAGCDPAIDPEAASSTNNLFIANRVKGNELGGLASTGAASDAARNYPDPGKQATDTGGFRQTIDGWVKLQIPVNFGPTEMTRVIGRFRAARSGSVTGIALGLTKARAVGFGGVMTATVYKNTGIAGAAGVTTGLSVVINTDATTKKANTQNQDANTGSQFQAGDELYIVIQTANWVTNDAMSDVYASLEIED